MQARSCVPVARCGLVLVFQLFGPGSLLLPLCASMFSGVVVVAAMTPFDVLSTRLYNQVRS